ncbi:MAG: hypothetical protein U0K52_01185 [Clostridia bacterium]|jgi:hypothetical protein|nr:hypothetical protein [Clostridia bacterium]DAP68339.1 MAG TPA: hypothetical protein [Caudoviricetes sp.]
MAGSTAKTTTPQIAMKTELSYSTTLTGDRIKIGYVQKIGQLKALKDGQTYSALDLDEERMAKGKRKAEAVDIETMFIQETHKTMTGIADADTEIYLFLKYPESTASVAGKPLVQTVKCTIDIAGQEVNDGDFIKDTMRVFKNSKVVETDGYPIEGDATKFED